MLPRPFEPCIPTRAARVPDGPAWLHEIKHDGYRMMIRRQGERVRLFTRRGYDWSERYPLIVAAAQKLKATSCVIDAEAVWCRPDGVADFEALHGRTLDDEVIAYGFDLLELDGEDLRPHALEARKLRLVRLLARSREGILLNEHIEGEAGAAMYVHACRMGLEGIVSKHREQPYRPGPSKAWLKIKNPASPAMQRVLDGPF